MTNEEKKESSLSENLTAVGQIIIGEIESLGGIITGDPMTSAEGDFNIQVGTLHQDSSEALSETESNETTNIDKTRKSNQAQE